MRRLPRRLPFLVAILAAGGILLLLLRPAAVPVEAGRVTRGALLATIDEEGVTRIHPRHVVAAPVAGRLAPIAVNEGDPVRAGESVARITPLPLDPRGRRQAQATLQAARAAEAEARALLAEKRASLAQARSTLARSERLAAEGQLSPEELDRTRTAAETLAKAVEAAQHRLEAARCESEVARAALLERGGGATIDVCAPSGGRVLRLYEESERVVPAGTPLLEIGDTSQLEVVVDVLSTDALGIRPGAEMILDAGSGTTCRARVRLIEPAGFTKISPLGVEEQRVNVVGDLVEPVPPLGDRFRVEARIVLWEGKDVLKVPAGAVFRSGDGWGLFVIEKGRARRRALKIGHRSAREVETLDGVAEGETVVLYPSDRLSDGARVLVKAS